MNYQKLATNIFRCLAPLCILFLAACNAIGGHQGTTPTSTSTPFLGDLTPKGPGSAALTATALSTPVVVICHVPSATSADMQGWQIYTDTHYPFHFSFPGGWKIGQTYFTSADGSSSYYEVMVLPSTGHTPVTEFSAITEPEYIQLSIVLTGQADQFSQESSWVPETTPVVLSHVSTKRSHRFSPDCGELNYATDPVTFGNHPYFFYQESRDQADKAKDTQFFLEMVKSFSYTGAN